MSAESTVFFHSSLHKNIEGHLRGSFLQSGVTTLTFNPKTSFSYAAIFLYTSIFKNA